MDKTTNHFDINTLLEGFKIVGNRAKAGDAEADKDFATLEKDINNCLNCVFTITYQIIRDDVNRAIRPDAVQNSGETDAAIKTASESVAEMKQILSRYGVEGFFTGDINDTDQVKEFCKELVEGLYAMR